MSSVLFHRRSREAVAWLVAWIVVEVLSLVAVAWNPRWGLVAHGNWRNDDLAVLLLLIALVAVAVPMHYWNDDSRRWRRLHAWNTRAVGFRYLHALNGAKHRMEDTPINGFLTILSIRAAITIFLLVGLLQTQVNYGLLPPRAGVHSVDWPRMAEAPSAVFFVFVGAALGVSLVSTMAALLCSDYAQRFEWTDRPDKQPNLVKLALRRKAHQFNVLGFYCLMWSLAAATALVDYAVCLVASLVVFLAMWTYYFFEPGLDDAADAADGGAERSADDPGVPEAPAV